MCPPRGAWVFRWTFSPPSPPPFSSSFSSIPPNFYSYQAEKSSSFVPTQPRKAQVFVSLRYRKRRGGSGSLAVYAILFCLKASLINLPKTISNFLTLWHLILLYCSVGFSLVCGYIGVYPHTIHLKNRAWSPPLPSPSLPLPSLRHVFYIDFKIQDGHHFFYLFFFSFFYSVEGVGGHWQGGYRGGPL